MSTPIAPVIGVQLDLGRQKETLEWIESFIDFIAVNGYNTLFLHLESAVRTSNFAFADPDKSYSADEIRRINNYARTRGITAIPVVATLGHAEHFVGHSELAHLSEQREEPPETRRGEFCPSLPETYEFLAVFLREVAALFPGTPIHVGCDEVFRLGSCSACRARLAAGESRADIFLKHVQAIRAIVTEELGRPMLIWDDMADFLPELIDRMPKDVGMVFWEYEPIVESKPTKFGNRLNLDIFRRYADAGIADYYAAPREVQLSNIGTMTEYARRYPVRGMLLTVWEHGTDFMERFYPQIAWAGRIWRDREGVKRGDAVFAEVVRDLFGIDDPALTAAARTVCETGEGPAAMPDDPAFRSGIRKLPNAATPGCMAAQELAEAVLAAAQPRITNPTGARVLRDMLAFVRRRLGDMRIGLWINASLRAKLASEPQPGGDGLRADLDAEQRRYRADWDVIRTGLNPNQFEAAQQQRLAAFDRVAAWLPMVETVLEVRLFLPDHWGRQTIEFMLRRPGGEYVTVLGGMLKPGEIGERPYFTIYAPVPDASATELKISSFGWNGIGVSYVRVLRRSAPSLVPAAITAQRNQVADAVNLLTDDTTWTMFGNRDGLRLVFDSSAGAMRHELDLVLA